METVELIALTMGVGWASGINLYAAVMMLGLLGMTGNIELPQSMQVVQNPLVLGAATIMYLVEFLVDKVPGVDTVWDAIHTFIRIPAGAMLAASAVGDVTPAVEFSAFLTGGGLAATSHTIKAGSRAVINTSPEPFSNWIASITEDFVVIGGLFAALNHPIGFLIFLVLFILFAIWILPKIWLGVKRVYGDLKRFFSSDKNPKRKPAKTLPED